MCYEPAVADMHFNFFAESALGGNPVKIADKEHPEEHFRVDGRAAGMAVKMFYLASDKAQIDVLVHQSQEMTFRDQFVHPDVVEHGLASVVFS